ncbi:MAG: hypothetical protein US83_C0016G0006 [Candidatus Falkowbacteria bacterium GW2011_GWC2_38_22]|uniref:UPF0235 protein US91_C0012G0006 n=1 Tax=Candidatus Falkowbacteria bacterium GW2011_GWE1_38_31 TaxID=1618638 RepID=A0A0G0JSJ1_9BACT|nr:MAG: hypothetical protein US73_C0014G0006 [Candidatus Falkowbacteria bacterium GW2011_GWF2_38_1205]KKQ60534.1 MAG: hypothetical protein US83_C0016G0006 [Candidatus Falkowbacteria bacterium GW2011_GWC2_38_22]KKQ62653.1 MAG: hypothetical protein US84_C0013G0006 [Candidatus Falkowbacteria bacterium GW2011_GWF1_38_22]KKQ64713.1 MAG: hypothetical protein US87_C0013G0006 [Candidatus Falkowbacteria bacterium GW2011_GWE2_38_254]KKQ69592.1 MAG: hypothetical protein US91_C0012G0006 [Candidatus Falkowb
MLSKFQDKLNANKELYLRVKVRPGSSKNEVNQILDDDTIKISIAAKPINNQANKELIKFLSKIFAVATDQIKIISGKSESLKLIKIIK